MTPSEWLACDDILPMLEFLRGRSGERKLRLFACACVRRQWHRLHDERSRACVDGAEWFADGLGSADGLHALYVAGMRAADSTAVRVSLGASWYAARAAAMTCVPQMSEDLAGRVAAEAAISARGDEAASATPAHDPDERRAQADVLREIMGDPSRPVALDRAVLAWNDGTVARLAEAIHTRASYEDMPLLHDALLDAGCDDDNILTHCRTAEGHVKGCWVLDLLLGKA